MSSKDNKDLESKIQDISKRLSVIEELLIELFTKNNTKKKVKTSRFSEPKTKPIKNPDSRKNFLKRYSKEKNLKREISDIVNPYERISIRINNILEIYGSEKDEEYKFNKKARINDVKKYQEQLYMLRFDLLKKILSPHYYGHNDNNEEIILESIWLLEELESTYGKNTLEKQIIQDLKNHLIHYNLDYVLEVISSLIKNAKNAEKFAKDEGYFEEYKKSLLNVGMIRND